MSSSNEYENLDSLSVSSIWSRAIVRDQLCVEINKHGSTDILDKLNHNYKSTQSNFQAQLSLYSAEDPSPSPIPPIGPGWTPNHLPDIPNDFNFELPGTSPVSGETPDTGGPNRGPQKSQPIKIGIVGGGMCGLYIAFILDALKIDGVSYEILEANPERIGGRAYTHYFTPRPEPHKRCTHHKKCLAHRECNEHARCKAHKGCDPHGPCDPAAQCTDTWSCRLHAPCHPQKPCEQTRSHDYYDVGAMRFPVFHMMERFFKHCEATSTKVVPHYHSYGTQNCPARFNNVVKIKPLSAQQWDRNPFDVITSTPLPPGDPSDILQNAMEPFLTIMRAAKTFREKQIALKVLMTQDNLSTREYLRINRPHLSHDIIEYLETFEGQTDLFTCGFPDSLFQTIDFNTKEWRCIEGGTQLLAENTCEMLKTQPEMGKKVTRVALKVGEDHKHKGKYPMKVSIEGESKHRKYSTVFITTPLGCTQRINLDDAEINWGHRTAIRTLHYMTATKVAMKFKRMWWISALKISKGGIGSTDEPLRQCVYPSYNIHDDPEEPGVLLCSYQWTQDAFRIGSLILPSSPGGEDELKELLLQGLARLHRYPYEKLKEMYITHHAYDWYHNPLSVSAVAVFRPGQFTNLYPMLTRPAGQGLLQFAGEAFASNHGWILSALESGWRAVDDFLIRFNMEKERVRLRELFGEVPEVEGKLPDDKKNLGKVANDVQKLQVLLGSLPAKEQKEVHLSPQEQSEMYKVYH